MAVLEVNVTDFSGGAATLQSDVIPGDQPMSNVEPKTFYCAFTMPFFYNRATVTANSFGGFLPGHTVLKRSTALNCKPSTSRDVASRTRHGQAL